MVDEAYFEFSRGTVRPYLAQHKNLVILRTFSKAFSLAGVRVGYLLGNPEVIREFLKVRQPYSVDAVSQAIARVVFRNRAKFERGIMQIVSERGRVFRELSQHAGRHGVPLERQLRPVPRGRRGARCGSSSTTAASSCATSAARPCCRIACGSPSAAPRRTTSS